MSAGMIFVLWKGFVGFVLPIAFGIRELHKLRGYRDQDRAELAALAQRARTVPRADKTPPEVPSKLRPKVLEPV
jgi:hypothetical protein